MTSNMVPDEIIEAYVFANTPTYLYRKLIGSEYVRGLSRHSGDTLISTILAAETNDVTSIANAYAAFIAMLLKGSKSSELTKFPSSHKLEWSNSIASIFNQRHSSHTISKIALPKLVIDKPMRHATPRNSTFTLTKMK